MSAACMTFGDSRPCAAVAADCNSVRIVPAVIRISSEGTADRIRSGVGP
jgi:hypothetical protein